MFAHHYLLRVPRNTTVEKECGPYVVMLNFKLLFPINEISNFQYIINRVKATSCCVITQGFSVLFETGKMLGK